MKKNIDVVIASPGKTFVNEYVLSLSKTIDALNEKNISWRWVYGDHAVVHKAREVALNQANTYNYKKIFWIDSDISWTTEDFFNIYFSNFDIFFGTYCQSKYFYESVEESVETYTYIDSLDEKLDKSLTRKEILSFAKKNIIMSVEANGFGFVCIENNAMNFLKNPFFPTTILTNNKKEKKERVIYDEDISWCIKMKKNNYEILCNPKVLVSHHKTCVI
jgi:hypothetical protein